MAPKVNFKFEISIDNPDMMPELMERTKDLRPVFDDIISKWARNNRDKFDASAGMEMSGAQIDPTVYWEPLTPGYIKSKRRAGYPNQIMVATGALEEALTSEEGFFHETTALQAVFGTPMAPEEEMKVKYNWKRNGEFLRPAIFLGLADQKMIEDDIQNYLSFGEEWKEHMFVRGVANVQRREEISQMDLEFNDVIAGVE